MARLIPLVEVNEISVKPERDTARALIAQLPEDVTVFHSYPWLRAERNDHDGKITLKEGETDFVIIIIDLGFLVLEVKGGEIVFDQENLQWYRILPNGNRRQIKDPFKQASTNMHVLKQKVVSTAFPGQGYPPCAFGYAVVFPDCDYTGHPPPGGDDAIILSSKDMPYLGRRIPDILRKWGRGKNEHGLTKEQVRKMLEAMRSTFNLIPVLSRQIEEEYDALVRLTEEQARLLDFLELHDRCMIKGVAGSGKTLLAMEQARRFAKKGKKTLFVCYNRTLAEWLRACLSDEDCAQIDVFHFHGLCFEICKRAGVKCQPTDKHHEKFFRNEAPTLLMDAVDRNGPLYDAIVVDEGQDFDSQWWLPLELLCHEADKSPLFLFYDPAQNLFVDQLGLPDLGTPYTLMINCRNTRNIVKTCAAIRNIEITVHQAAPEGKKVIVRECPTPENQRRVCDEIFKDLKKGGLSPNQIVIQSPYRSDNKSSSFLGMQKIGGYPVVTSIDEWRAGEGVLFTTIRSFKGLEADAVILVDILDPKEQNFFTVNDLYVGASRAKHFLAILSQDQFLEDKEL